MLPMPTSLPDLVTLPAALGLALQPAWFQPVLERLQWIGQSPALILLGSLLIGCSWLVRRGARSPQISTPAPEPAAPALAAAQLQETARR